MVKIILGANGLHDAIDKEKGTGIVERKKFMALGVIFQTLLEDVMLQMAKYSEPTDVCEALRARYLGAERTQKARVQMLRAELDGLKMGETESIVDHVAKLGGVQSKYKSFGAVLEEEVLKQVQECEWKFIRQLMFTQTEKKVENYRGRGRGRGRYNGRERGNLRWNGELENDERVKYWKKSPGEWQDGRKYVTCYNCYKIGHHSNECKEPSKGNEEVNLTKKEDDIGPSLFMKVCSIKKVSLNEERVIPGVFAKVEKNEGTWYFDNGASHHMLGKKEFFTTLDERVSNQVKFGDGSEIEIIGKGNVTVVSETSEKKTFSDVFYILKLKTNILSLGQLDQEGCKIEIANGILRLYDQKERLLMKIQRNLNRTYNIKFQTIPNDLFGVRESIGQERIDEKNRVEKENGNIASKLSIEGTNVKFEESVKQSMLWSAEKKV
ncbi:uncharacterized protein LOC143535732 [Bidens hawaiensis]|uniref:uncharacterized protein LOC143535732 n=1 Tax=Bidens hawaiensis TaxID=980011 RepID=UPI00404A9FF0